MKTILLTAAVLMGLLQSSWAYSLGGPIANGGDAWQVQTLSYDEPGDLNAPKNLGEEFRRNTPVMFYTYDQNFDDYFGSSGQNSVDRAFTILNLTFTNSPTGPKRGLDGYSADLSEFPLQARHINYQAQALGIVDMKSITLSLMTEQLGLTDPVRFTWTLHDRYLPSGTTCPTGEEYLVVQRNFDFTSSPLNRLQYSAYVNDVFYTYQVTEACTGTPWLADAVPSSVDPLADIYSPVASEFSSTLVWGDYFSGLTRDDVAGLRYLMATNNVNYEDVSADSLLYLITTNTANPVVFPPYVTSGTNSVSTTNGGYYVYSGTTNGGYGYGDYAAFLAFAKTNPPDVLQAAYPGVVINTVSNSQTIVSNATYFSYYTNAAVGSPYGSPPVLVLVTNYTKVYQFLYYYTFANVFPYHTGTTYSLLQSVTVGTPIGAPYGSAGTTNTITRKIATFSGDFFVLAPFYTGFCPIDIRTAAGSITAVLATTNFYGTALTNSVTTNLVSYTYLVTYFTNYSYVINPVSCIAEAGASGYFQGIEKIQFVKIPFTNYDTINHRFITPVTNNYTLNLVTNGQVQVLHLQRILTVPDILFSAADLASGPGGIPAVPYFARNLDFDTAHVLTQLAGPGTITTPTLITWDKVGPVYYNSPEILGVMDGTTYFTQNPGGDVTNSFYLEYFVLGSYDGTTNDPTVFPNGTSIDNLENQVLVHVSPGSVPNGSVGETYAATSFSASGGSFSTPFTWSAAGLPPGLSVSSSGVLAGTPTGSGTYDFTLTLTDSTGQTIQWFYTLTIQ